MSQDVINLVCGMDAGSVETQMALQCAPLIVGLKISNLFTIYNSQLKKMKRLLVRSQISFYVLYAGEDRSTILLYNVRQLYAYLMRPEVWKFMERCGYKSGDLSEVLAMFRRHYQLYRAGKRKFPDELGALLGYPIEDIEGYVENDGKNALYTGYWKVYADVEGKKDLFRMFELAKETLIELVCSGVPMTEIIATYCGE